jgi:hypothetical protein
MADSNQLIAQSKRADDLGRGRQQRNDPHRSSLAAEGARPSGEVRTARSSAWRRTPARCSPARPSPVRTPTPRPTLAENAVHRCGRY